ncbi:hypothetical protein C9439_00825 [archaeon SCG-AAA382B04]|nr:hypothetical protein C9439_00825 [archaeon SCG-AAA382B04]
MRRLKGIIRKEKPLVIGISANTGSYLNGLKIVKKIKDIDKDIITVMGGTHPTIMTKEVLEEDGIDFLVLGEGEKTTLDLMDSIKNNKSIDEVNGIAYREKEKNENKIKINESSEYIKDLDKLPFPDRTLFPLSFYEYPASILMSRGGCSYGCDFCAVNNIWEGERRFRSPNDVAEEVKHLIRTLKTREIGFVDDIFTLNKEYTRNLLKSLDRIKTPFKWTCATRVDLVDKPLLQKMHKSGCSGIEFGVETGSQRVLDSINKDITVNRVKEVVKIANEIGFNTLCSFMFPLPEDDRESIRETVGFMKELKGMGANLIMSFTTPYPGTFLYENADDIGINILGSSWDEFDAKHLLIDTKYLSEKELKEMFKKITREVGLKK